MFVEWFLVVVLGEGGGSKFYFDGFGIAGGGCFFLVFGVWVYFYFLFYRVEIGKRRYVFEEVKMSNSDLFFIDSRVLGIFWSFLGSFREFLGSRWFFLVGRECYGGGLVWFFKVCMGF